MGTVVSVALNGACAGMEVFSEIASAYAGVGDGFGKRGVGTIGIKVWFGIQLSAITVQFSWIDYSKSMDIWYHSQHCDFETDRLKAKASNIHEAIHRASVLGAR